MKRPIKDILDELIDWYDNSSNEKKIADMDAEENPYDGLILNVSRKSPSEKHELTNSTYCVASGGFTTEVAMQLLGKVVEMIDGAPPEISGPAMLELATALSKTLNGHCQIGVMHTDTLKIETLDEFKRGIKEEPAPDLGGRKL